jgi:anti-sigma factor ChrR (cupin superfamily)
MAKTLKSKIDISEIIPENILAEMLTAMPIESPSAQRKSAMLTALLKNIDASSAGNSKPTVVKAGEGKWINFAPNVDMKILHDADGTRSWLARFGAGGSVPAHIQTGDEEAIVLTGWCYLDDEKICAGDYHRIGKGARHGNILSPEGCLIFVRSHSAKRHASQLVSAP